MIDEIRISNLGVIAEATLLLGPGFTAITGETGAGKTMVVTALDLLRGERADAAAVRAGAASAEVEGRWLLEHVAHLTDSEQSDSGAQAAPTLDTSVKSIVHDAGGQIDEGELILVRSVTSEGRSRAVVGGRSTPVGTLSVLGESLVAVHGQSEQVRLKSPSAQREALDRFAGEEFSQALAHYGRAFRQWRSDAAELTSLLDEREARVREAELLRQAVAEIESVAPQPGEDVELAALAERLTHTEDLRRALALARESFSSDADSPDVLGLVDTARRALEKVAHVDPALASLVGDLTDLSEKAHDVSHALSRELAALDGDGERDLDLIQERRAELVTLTRRYGPTLDEVIAHAEGASSRLAELESDDTRIAELSQQVAAQEQVVTERALDLHERRTVAAAQLGAAVTTELSALAMPHAELVVEVTAHSEPSATGIDSVALLLKPHPGADPRPVSKGASGGELSRIMLALEVVVAAQDGVPTYVFDEVDAGVGGAAAIEIGRRLARLAQTAQVIVVTHLAQVAAFANNHLRVLKDTSGEVTNSSVVRLEGAEREREMARLLSGLSDSDSGLAHARELLELARSR